MSTAEEYLPDYEPPKLSVIGPSAVQLMLDLENAGLITKRALELPPGIEYGSVEALGVFISEIVTRGNFYLGDWLLEVEAKLPEWFSQLSEATGRSEQTRLHLMSVCRAIPPSRRRDELLWGHHVAVYKLGANEQKRWLAAAVKNGWSAADLRQAMKADRIDSKPQIPGTEEADHHEPDMGLLLEAAKSLVRNAELAGENVIVRVEDYTRVKAALGEED